MIFKFNIYKDSEGFFIASTEYIGLCGWSPTFEEIESNATDIASLFENDFFKGKDETSGMPFVKTIEIKIEDKKKHD